MGVNKQILKAYGIGSFEEWCDELVQHINVFCLGSIASDMWHTMSASEQSLFIERIEYSDMYPTDKQLIIQTINKL